MEELSVHGNISRAAMKGDMDRKTAHKYATAGKLPSETKERRDWRTRRDPFANVWEEISKQLQEFPGLEAKTILEELQRREPEVYTFELLRTLQRRIRDWRATHGPETNVMLQQIHRPGERAQTDFTWTKELCITILGEPFVHMLCVFVLPYSNWRWATVCMSESLASIRRGVQRALFQLGRVPQFHQTDNSTAATHRIGEKALGARPFNDEYLAMMRHFSMTPCTTAVGEKQQNGDVESQNGVLKRQLEQALLLRGSRDFETMEAWQSFVDAVNRKANRARGKRVEEELACMTELSVDILPEYTEVTAQVTEGSTFRVKHCAYSVPSRLIGRVLRVRIYEDRIEAYYGSRAEPELSCERLRGKARHRIDYRHVVGSLLRKPGGFARYVYREEMFPTVTFRKAYDAIQNVEAGTRGDLEYLRILHLAASHVQDDVEAALALFLSEKVRISHDGVKTLLDAARQVFVPELSPCEVKLTNYDKLLSEVRT